MANNGFGGGSNFGFIPSKPSDIGRKTRQNQANMANQGYSQSGQTGGGFYGTGGNTGSGMSGGFQPTPDTSQPQPELNFSDPSTWGPSGDTMPGGGAPDPTTGQYDSTMSGQTSYGGPTYAPTYGSSYGSAGSPGIPSYMSPGFNPGGGQIGGGSFGGEGVFGSPNSGGYDQSPGGGGYGGNSFFNPITGQNSDPNSPMNQSNYQSPNTTFGDQPGYFDNLRESNETSALQRQQSQNELLEYRRSQGLAGGDSQRQMIDPNGNGRVFNRGPGNMGGVIDPSRYGGMLRPEGAAAINPDGTVNQNSNDDPLSQGRPNEGTGYYQNGQRQLFDYGHDVNGNPIFPQGNGGNGQATQQPIPYGPNPTGGNQPYGPNVPPGAMPGGAGEGIFPPPSVDGGGMGYPQVTDTVAPGEYPGKPEPETQKPVTDPYSGATPIIGSGQTPAGGPSKADRQARAQQQHQQLMQLLMGNQISSGDALEMMRYRGVSPAQYGNYYNQQYNL